MKQFKKLLAVLMCMGVVLSVTACGSNNNEKDNGSTANPTTDNNDNGDNLGTGDGNDATTAKDRGDVNDVTDGTDNGDGEGVMDEIGDNLKNGAEDIGNDVTGNENRNNTGSTNNR